MPSRNKVQSFPWLREQSFCYLILGLFQKKIAVAKISFDTFEEKRVFAFGVGVDALH